MRESRTYISQHVSASYQPFTRKFDKTRRNDPCWCGSGNKYKKCCIDKVRE